MSDDQNVIDVEAVEIEETPNLPAVVDDAWNSEPMKPNRQDALLADNAERRCVAHRKNGERCRKFAIMGSTVCRTHGGATEHVRNRARVRVENASDRLMGRLIQFAFDDTKPPDIQLRAIKDALDRAGLRPPAEVVVAHVEPKPWEMVFDSIGGTPDDEVFQSLSDQGQGRELDESDSETTGSAVAGEDPSTSPAVALHPETAAEPTSSPEGSPVSDTSPPPSPSPRAVDRDSAPRPPERHITGEAAMRVANWANAAMADSHGLPWGDSARTRR